MLAILAATVMVPHHVIHKRKHPRPIIQIERGYMGSHIKLNLGVTVHKMVFAHQHYTVGTGIVDSIMMVNKVRYYQIGWNDGTHSSETNWDIWTDPFVKL